FRFVLFVYFSFFFSNFLAWSTFLCSLFLIVNCFVADHVCLLVVRRRVCEQQERAVDDQWWIECCDGCQRVDDRGAAHRVQCRVVELRGQWDVDIDRLRGGVQYVDHQWCVLCWARSDHHVGQFLVFRCRYHCQCVPNHLCQHSRSVLFPGRDESGQVE